MNEEIKKEISESIRGFRLPRYREIPDVGLFLEQVSKYLLQNLSPLQNISITPSMISNYVKMDLIRNPVKKQYDREQIARLLFITVAKTVLSLEDIRLLCELQRETYPDERAYDYFCDELENMLYAVFGLKEKPEEVGIDSTDEKILLRSTIIAVAYKAYIDKCFAAIKHEKTL
ncbi:MAG: DUF1836 domain-containing protein [Erysipelotrichaceae bacterium]|nr:DUF1836 domain-containing protein [Erysipelotrichaceae bacterium]